MINFRIIREDFLWVYILKTFAIVLPIRNHDLKKCMIYYEYRNILFSFSIYCEYHNILCGLLNEVLSKIGNNWKFFLNLAHIKKIFCLPSIKWTPLKE